MYKYSVYVDGEFIHHHWTNKRMNDTQRSNYRYSFGKAYGISDKGIELVCKRVGS